MLYITISRNKKGEKYIFQNLAQNYSKILKIEIGCSSSLTKQNQSYQTALLALQSVSFEKNIALFDELDVEILLGSISEEIKLQFLEKTMSQLEEKEKNLLEVYFHCNLSLKDTCEKLYIHKNTVQYQLNKIKEISGYNPRIFQEAFILYLGLCLEKF